MKMSIKILACAVAVIALFACLDNKSEVNLPLYDPNVVIIGDDLKKWIEMQLASEGNEKKRVRISDMHIREKTIEPIYARSEYNPETGENEYYVNEKKMTAKEYEIFMEKYWEEYYKQIGKRNLPIPGMISEDAVGWIAIVTAEEISELIKNYKELAIDFHGDSWAPLDTSSKMPVMSDRVVSYQRAGGYGLRGIVSNQDTLKLWFPKDYDEQSKECNYFAIYNTTSSTGSGYLILADDMVLYSLTPRYGWNGCAMTADIFVETMLVCDDQANTFKDGIDLNGTYAVPSWDCYDWETEPKKGFF